LPANCKSLPRGTPAFSSPFEATSRSVFKLRF
jgi:hypothetical protein